MKRVLIALTTALALAVGVAGAQAKTFDFPGLPGGDGGGGTQQAAVAGTVVSVNPTAGSFVADAYVLAPPSMGGGGSSGGFGFGFPGLGGSGGFSGDARPSDVSVTPPATTRVTITTNASTTIHIGGMDEGMSGDGTGVAAPTVGDLVPGAKFLALFPGSSSDTIQTLVANPATDVFAQVPKQFYAFVGTVTATTPSTSTTPGTVTVTVMRSLPSALVTGGSSATFTVDSRTLIIGGSSLSGSGGGLFGGLFGGSLGSVAVNDLVAGGLIGDAGLTATQVESTPLMFMLDLPAPAATTGSTTTSAATKALKTTLKLLHGGKVKINKHGHKHHHKAKRTKKSHAGRH